MYKYNNILRQFMKLLQGGGNVIIGIPKEIKKNEYRVSATPTSVSELIDQGHIVLVEQGAGTGSGFEDNEYKAVGARIVDLDTIFKQSELIYKVKEILPEEYNYMREGLIVVTYLHSNAHKEMTDLLLEKKVVGIAYEDIIDKNGGFPLLKPMSQLAGKGGFLAALHFGQKVHGGKGILLNRIIGINAPEVTIIGAGHAGMGAAELASAFGCRVRILDLNLEKLEDARQKLPSNAEMLYSTRANLVKCLQDTEVLINCILWPKTRTDHLINREDLKLMKHGAMIIDVSCDDEGAIETSHSTSHDDPIYFVDGIMHYAVDNIPSAFSHTASNSLANATLPYVMEIANKGYKRALKDNPGLLRGLSFYYGKLTLEETAIKQNRQYTSPDSIVEEF